MIKGLFAWGKFLGIFYASGEILGKFWNIAGKFFWRELGTLRSPMHEPKARGNPQSASQQVPDSVTMEFEQQKEIRSVK